MSLQDRGNALKSRPHIRTMAGLLFSCLLFVFFWRRNFELILVIGPSMLPTFGTGDLLLIDKRAYQRRPIERGDIVVAQHNREFIIKRVIGLPGESVELRSGVLYIG